LTPCVESNYYQRPFPRATATRRSRQTDLRYYFTLLFQLCIEKASAVLAKMQVCDALDLLQNLIFQLSIKSDFPTPSHSIAARS
jgi:hypothetical protein